MTTSNRGDANQLCEPITPAEKKMGNIAQCIAQAMDNVLPHRSLFFSIFFKLQMQCCCKYKSIKRTFVHMSQKAEDLLLSKSIRKTPFRVKVLDIFMSNRSQAMDTAMVEQRLDDFDRITLYRTIKKFEEEGIIHQAIDGTNEKKYALCGEKCSSHNHTDNHAHFVCSSCSQTSCIEYTIPNISAPAEYQVDQVHIALKGICPSCQA